MTDTLDALRDIIQEDVGGRGLAKDPTENLITACASDLRSACHSLGDAVKPSLAVLTGFFIPTGQPPAGETDGPLGALFLAQALVPLDIRVVLVSDAFCTNALHAGLNQCGLDKRVTLVTLPDYAASQELGPARYWERFLQESGPITHFLSIERVGPNYQAGNHNLPAAFALEVPPEKQDRCYSMRGRDITEEMSPAHWLLEAAAKHKPRIVTLGIGDGGNEIGMGKIPWGVIQRNIPRGGLVACRVPADHLIVAGISNWGAYGLAAGIRYVRGGGLDMDLFDPVREHALLETMVHNGPLVDGVTGSQSATVDGLEFSRYGQILPRLVKAWGA